MKNVTFPNGPIKMAGDLHLPKEPPLAGAPAVSKFGGIVLSQCGATCV
jgi:hypothetical protein